MITETVRIDWIRDQTFLMKDRFGFSLVMTQLSGMNAIDLNEEYIKRAIELTEQKYCSTYATLRDTIELTSKYKILNPGKG